MSIPSFRHDTPALWTDIQARTIEAFLSLLSHPDPSLLNNDSPEECTRPATLCIYISRSRTVIVVLETLSDPFDCRQLSIPGSSMGYATTTTTTTRSTTRPTTRSTTTRPTATVATIVTAVSIPS